MWIERGHFYRIAQKAHLYMTTANGGVEWMEEK